MLDCAIRSKEPRRYLALWFPYLPTDRLARSVPPNCAASAEGAAGGPLALVERQRGAIRLAACDPLAARLGMAPGMTLAAARAQVPDLRVEEADPIADANWLERIADACDRFTPLVASEPPDGLVLDVSGCAHLFGGKSGLVAAVEQCMARWAGYLRHALASTPEGARALARFQSVSAVDEREALRRLPVAALELGRESETALRRAGLKRLGELADRPDATLAARFGPELVDRLDRVLGRTGSRIAARGKLPDLQFERRFAEPLIRADDALAVLGELAAEACAVLEARRRGGRRFLARLYRSDGHVAALAVESGLPLRDAQRIVQLFTERVNALADPIDPGFGFDMVRLAVPACEPLAAAQLALEGGAANEEGVAALVDRLSARAGRGRIRSFAPRDTHLPEQKVLALPAIDAPQPQAWPAPEPGEPPLRPIHLFDPPQQVQVIAAVPDGPPQRFRWRRALHEVARFEGPERIAAQWWLRASDDPEATRDYYRVEDVRGRRFWLFRHGLYGERDGDPRWYVHGLFA